jgi:hypothetical protein
MLSSRPQRNLPPNNGLTVYDERVAYRPPFLFASD